MERGLGWRGTVGWSVTGVAALHAAYAWPGAGWLVLVYLLAMFMLARVASVRVAFWLGLGIGLAVFAPQLAFFWRIFKIAALPLWSILALFIALYLATARACVGRWPRWGVLLLPVLWTGLEYFRSEVWHLRFAWVTPGLAVSDATWSWLLLFGCYGVSLGWMGLLAVTYLIPAKWPWRAGVLALALAVWFFIGSWHDRPPTPGVEVAGMQFEFVQEAQLVKGLDKALAAHPEAEILVLSEYTFQGPTPAEITDWCRLHGKYVVAGGKEPVAPGSETWYNTAYVIDPQGEIVFKQVKSVPIQFFDDGEPAPSQRVWESPWGKIGIAICYDLSYTRVIDELVRQGAVGLIIPTMDVEEWGARQHALHAKVAPTRAREYRVPIFRVCSSGESQLVDLRGNVRATAGFPGQGEVIGGWFGLSRRGHLPIDRYLAPLCSAGVGLVWLALLPWVSWRRRCARWRRGDR